ncbi:MAG: hypothetical protein C4519_16120 [Desulfobacteraceae bacterium]|nr:MAG: hypothetical protein C4519_16120 [Desulfobacteraceae bacterium]
MMLHQDGSKHQWVSGLFWDPIDTMDDATSDGKLRSDEQPFHPTMFVHFRKRINQQLIFKINESISQKALQGTNKSDKDDDAFGGGSPCGPGEQKEQENP